MGSLELLNCDKGVLKTRKKSKESSILVKLQQEKQVCLLKSFVRAQKFETHHFSTALKPLKENSDFVLSINCHCPHLY